MGNLNTTPQMTNKSRRNVRVFVTEQALELDAFIALQDGGDDKSWKNLPKLPGDKKFIFKKDIKSDRVLASQNQQIPYVADHFLSVFVEDEDNQEICSKQIMHNMKLTAPFSVLLYDV
ncbi:hypothetical protein GBF38_009647 [Nibea albiflora]|uniref:Uncharacterized protein n=1 Tax=Nibea albiflora TaxID=240163 RepID=A0ACB7F7W2_NIBAL|nr:hypothetical protein GBF38_009647 [Nibea albiflora]